MNWSTEPTCCVWDDCVQGDLLLMLTSVTVLRAKTVPQTIVASLAAFWPGCSLQAPFTPNICNVNPNLAGIVSAKFWHPKLATSATHAPCLIIQWEWKIYNVKTSKGYSLRAVPEIILGGGTFFFRTLHPQDTHGVRAPRPPGHVRALINLPHYGSNMPWPPGQVTPPPPTPRTHC